MASIDLCTVEDVRRLLQKQDGERANDPVLGWLITQASRLIMRRTRRQFAPQESGVSKQFDYDGGPFLRLVPYDARTVTAVKMDTVDGTGGTVLVANTDYKLRPKPSQFGVFNRIEFSPYVVSTSTFSTAEVTVTGDWGFPTIPEEVVLAAALTVRDWFRDGVAAFGTRFNPETDQFEVPEALPAAVVSMLRGMSAPLVV